MTTANRAEDRAAPLTPSPRLVSVDALRGFDMCWIIGAGTFVQSWIGISRNPFTIFLNGQMDHVEWEGFGFYDLIYPLFVFLVGVSIVFSQDKNRGTEPRRKQVVRILRRGLILYVWNFLFNGGFSTRWPDIRVASGVLAMIAAAYVIAALIYCFFADRLKVIAGITLALLLGYWALLGLTPFPDFHLNQKTVNALAEKAGSRSPAMISAMVPERISGVYEEGYNFSNYADFRLLPGRMLNRYYESQGLLSPISASTVCLLGIFAARLLKFQAIEPRRRVLWLAVGGIAAILLGALWSLEFPIVKKLWSSSFCLITAGCGALLLAVFNLIVDVWGFQRWCQPLVWIGSNSIVLYLLSRFVNFRDLAKHLVGGNVEDFLNRLLPGSGAAAIELAALLLMVLVARFLHHRRIFLRV